MREAEAAWNWNASEGNSLTLTGRWDYHGGLSSQFPIPQLRVVYAASGTVPCATVVRDLHSVVEHGLYVFRASERLEADYLSAVLNCEYARKLVEEMQARGQWGARHFDKVMFNLPIPRFDPANVLHKDLAKTSVEAEVIAAAVTIAETTGFQRARKMVRNALKEAGVDREYRRAGG